jgi:hypothetical protein
VDGIPGSEPTAHVRDDLDPGGELQGRGELPLPLVIGLIAVGLLQRLHRARGQCVVGVEELAAVTGTGHHHDGRGAISHDALGRLEAGHHWQHDVHRDYIGTKLLAELHTAAAVGGFPDDLELGVGAQHLEQALANGDRVLDHEHANSPQEPS